MTITTKEIQEMYGVGYDYVAYRAGKFKKLGNSKPVKYDRTSVLEVMDASKPEVALQRAFDKLPKNSVSDDGELKTQLENSKNYVTELLERLGNSAVQYLELNEQLEKSKKYNDDLQGDYDAMEAKCNALSYKYES